MPPCTSRMWREVTSVSCPGLLVASRNKQISGQWPTPWTSLHFKTPPRLCPEVTNTTDTKKKLFWLWSGYAGEGMERAIGSAGCQKTLFPGRSLQCHKLIPTGLQNPLDLLSMEVSKNENSWITRDHWLGIHKSNNNKKRVGGLWSGLWYAEKRFFSCV